MYRNLLEKLLAFFIFLTLLPLAGMGQTGQGRQRNFIYVLDCTKSMNGYNDALDIWQQTKNYLSRELRKEAQAHPDARIVILPFQDKVLQRYESTASNLSWTDLEASLDKYIQNVTATNICDPWLAAEREIDETKENYIILMTDGNDNYKGDPSHPDRIAYLKKIFSEFCGKYGNIMGVYLELTQSATLPADVRAVVDNCKDIVIVDGKNGNPRYGLWSSTAVNVSTRDLPIDKEIGFSSTDSYDVEAVMDEYSPVTVKVGRISGGKAKIHIESKYGDDIDRLNEYLDKNGREISFITHSDEVDIKNPEITIEFSTAEMRTFALDQAGIASQDLRRTKPFLWIKGNDFDTLRWDLNPRFNQAAVNDNAWVKFRINAKSDVGGCRLLFNGKELTDSNIIVKVGDPGVVALVVPAESGDGDVDITLTKLRGSNVDRINGKHLDSSDLAITLTGKVDTSKSIVEKILWALGALIVISLIAWFAFIKKRIYPKFMGGSVTVSQPYFATIKLKGVRKVILTPTKKRQNGFSRLFTGEVRYHVNPEWSSECELTPSCKNNIRFSSKNGAMVATPSPLWQKYGSYEAKRKDSDGKAIKVSIN